MLIQSFCSGPFSTNAYVIACTQTQEAAVIDPAPDSFQPIQIFLEKHHLNLKKIILTHSHWDHIADVKSFKDAYQIPIYIHSLDVSNLQHPGSDGLPCWIFIHSVEPDNLIEEGMLLDVGQLQFMVLHTPGHSPGSICLFEPHHHLLFSGDTLFQGTIGNLSFPTSQPEQMWSSLAKLEKLPPDTRIYPGHGPMTTIARELNWLPQAKKLFDK